MVFASIRSCLDYLRHRLLLATYELDAFVYFTIWLLFRCNLRPQLHQQWSITNRTYSISDLFELLHSMPMVSGGEILLPRRLTMRLIHRWTDRVSLWIRWSLDWVLYVSALLNHWIKAMFGCRWAWSILQNSPKMMQPKRRNFILNHLGNLVNSWRASSASENTQMCRIFLSMWCQVRPGGNWHLARTRISLANSRKLSGH